MHSNELQTGYREYRERSGDRRDTKGETGLAGGRIGRRANKNKCEGYDERDGKKNERYEGGTAGGCKGEEGDDKRRRIEARNKSKIVEIKTAVGRKVGANPRARARARKLKTNSECAGCGG